MSNAFAKLMEKRTSDTNRASRSRGRAKHDGWFGYIRVKADMKTDEMKTAAKCLNCKRTFMSTEKGRLKKHRVTCGSDNIANESDAQGDKGWFGHIKVKVKRLRGMKFAAKCLNCKKKFINKSKVRLEKHREICGSENIDESDVEGKKGWFGHIKVQVDGRPRGMQIAAKCLNCKKTFTNTAKARLEKHRVTCGSDNIANEFDAESETVVPDGDDDDIEMHSTDTHNSELAALTGNPSDTLGLDSRPTSSFSIKQEFNSPPPNRPGSSLSATTFTPAACERAFRLPENEIEHVNIEQFLDSLSAAEDDRLDMLLAEFFFACNVPFLACESKYFKKFINALHPAYNPPTRHQLTTHLLERTHDKILKRNSEKTARMGKQAVLLIDGWQNSSADQHYVVMMLATPNDEKVYLDSFDFSDIPETGSNLTKALKEAIALAKERFDIKVYAVVSGHALAMESMGTSVRALGLLFSACNAHTGDLLAGDLLDKTKYEKIMNKVMTVQKDFRRTALLDRLMKVGGKKPALSCTTRWTSQRNAAESFLVNLSKMKKVAAACHAEKAIDKDATAPKPHVFKLLFDGQFVASVKETLEMLDPVAKLTNKCQQSNFSAGDAVEEWMSLYEEGPEALRSFLDYRCKKSDVFNITALTANYFHPIYRGQKLSQEQRDRVNDYAFEELNSDGLESKRLFTADAGIFAALNRKKFSSPTTYWHYATEKGHGILATFALKCLYVPSSTAPLEGLVSSWANRDKCNRLSFETSKKVIDVYFSLQTADEVAIESDDENE